MPWTLLTLRHVWIVLRESKPTRSKDLLEIIHTNICYPDMDRSDPKYFITFIDDYSRYMYLYMLCSKNEALETFKVFKVDVEKQCEKQKKVVRSYRGGDYYGRYTENGQAPSPFLDFFKCIELLPNTPCLVLRNKMVWRKEETKP